MTQAYSLQWPIGMPRTDRYRVADAAFKVTLGDAIRQVLDEVTRMGGTLVALARPGLARHFEQ